MVDANADGSCITSAPTWPIGSAPVRPVITIAERLNVSRRFVRVGRRQPAQQVVEHVLIERLQVGDLDGRLLELRFTLARPLGQRRR